MKFGLLRLTRVRFSPILMLILFQHMASFLPTFFMVTLMERISSFYFVFSLNPCSYCKNIASRFISSHSLLDSYKIQTWLVLLMLKDDIQMVDVSCIAYTKTENELPVIANICIENRTVIL